MIRTRCRILTTPLGKVLPFCRLSVPERIHVTEKLTHSWPILTVTFLLAPATRCKPRSLDSISSFWVFFSSDYICYKPMTDALVSNFQTTCGSLNQHFHQDAYKRSNNSKRNYCNECHFSKQFVVVSSYKDFKQKLWSHSKKVFQSLAFPCRSLPFLSLFRIYPRFVGEVHQDQFRKKFQESGLNLRMSVLGDTGSLNFEFYSG